MIANAADRRPATTPGKSCFQSCHNHGFTLAGTLYTNATGNTGFVGATMTVTDNNGVMQNSSRNERQLLHEPGDRVSGARDRELVSVGGEDEHSTTNGDCNKRAATSAAPNQMHLP